MGDTQPSSSHDEIVGRAFFWSLGAFVVIGLVIVVVVIVLRNRGEELLPDPELGEVAIPAGPSSVDRAEKIAMPFTDVRTAWGVDFEHNSGATGEKRLPETLGGGVAISDLDRDGRPDLVFIDGGPEASAQTPPHDMVVVYRNVLEEGEPTLKRQEGVPQLPGYGMGIATGDIDGDGDVDLFVTTVGRNRLLINQSTPGQIVLREATDEWGVPSLESWSTAAGFLDVDGDGDLDLVGLDYVSWSPQIDRDVDYRLDGVGRAYGPPTGYRGTQPFLLINDGRQVREESELRGVRQLNSASGESVGKGLGLAFLDIDTDGDLDIVAANDTTANAAWVNDGNGSFTERGIPIGLAFDRNGMATGAMGIDASYFRGDDVLGIAVGNFANEPTSLFVHRPDFPGFVDDGVLEGIAADSRGSLTFGVLFIDLDLDGYDDLVQANGHLEEEISIVQPSQQYSQRAQVFRNISAFSSGVAFAHIPADSLGDLAKPVVGRGLASGDLDLDGDADLVLTQIGGVPLLLRNDANTEPRSVRVRLSGRAPNTGAIGAEVLVDVGGRTMRRLVMPTRSYLSQVELPLLFGLGTADHADRILVRWPDGSTTAIDGPIEPGTFDITQP